MNPTTRFLSLVFGCWVGACLVCPVTNSWGQDNPEKKPATASAKEAATDQSDSPNLWCEYPGGEGPGAGKRIVLISGDEEYRSEESMPMLGKILSVYHGFDCTVLFAVDPQTGLIDPACQTNIPGMQRIEGADLIVLGLRFRNLPDEQMKFLVDHIQNGKPVIGFRTSTHAFKYAKDSQSPYKDYSFNSRKWPGGFGQQVLGDTWISHHGHHKVESARGVPVEAQKDHPILRGVDDVWGPSDVYGVRNLKESDTVLMLGQVLKGMSPSDEPVKGKKNDPMMPIAWTRDFTGEAGNVSKVFCTTMGAATDFANEGLRRMLVNACFWAVELETPEKVNVSFVEPFKPTDFGFGTFKKGIKPADYDLKKPVGVKP